MKHRPPIDPNAPIIIPPGNGGVFWGPALCVIPAGVLAAIFDWPNWVLWLGPIAGLGWEVSVQRREVRRIAAAWNAKLANERAAYKPGPEKTVSNEGEQQ